LHFGVYGENARAIIKVLCRVVDSYRGRLKRMSWLTCFIFYAL